MRSIHFVLLATLIAPAAQAGQDSADLARSVFTQSINSSSIAPSSATATKETATTPAATPSINPSAAQGQSSQGSGSAINQAAGQALMSAGSALMSNPSTRAEGAALMAMGVLAMMQAGHDAGAAGDSAATYGASSLDATAPTDPAAGNSGFNAASVKDSLAKLADAGYSVTTAGVKNPDGSVTPSSAFSSPGAMAAAGMDPKAVAEAKKVTDALNDEISKLNKSTSMAVSGGGGGGAAGENQNPAEESMKLNVGNFINPFALNAAARKSLVAGKTVMFDGEPIGVRGQNIFDMVHLAYQKKREGHSFIETEGNGPRQTMVRAPASVPRATALPAAVAKKKK